MNNLNMQERFLVVSHLKDCEQNRIVGSAHKMEFEKYYKLFLRLLPGIPFYIVPHVDKNNEYLIFSGLEKKNGKTRFFCKLGSGVLRHEENVLELHLPDLNQVYFLQLEPQSFQFEESSAA